MSDPFHAQAQARRQQYLVGFYNSYPDRRNAIHPDNEPWCTDNGGQACARCAPLVERYNEIRASMPKLAVWLEDAIEAILLRYWKLRLRFRKEGKD